MIEGIGAIAHVQQSAASATASKPQPELTDFVSQLGEAPGSAISKVENVIAGEDVELHTLMIELEVAKLQMQLAVEIRDKLVEAYQELSRMQV